MIELLKQLKLIYKNKIAHPNTIKKVLREHPTLENKIINHTSFLPPQSLIRERLVCILKNITSCPICPTCNQPLKFISRISDYTKFCSSKCAANSPEIQTKRKQTMLKLYNVENASQSNVIKQKKIKTSLKRFGVEYPLQHQTVKAKAKQTNLKRYNVEWSLQNDEIRKKIKQTNLRKFNSENPLGNIKIREKRKRTMVYRYNDEYFNNREKAKLTCLEKYGVDNPRKNDEIKRKIKQTKIEKYETINNRKKTIKTCLERYNVNNVKQVHNPEGFRLLANKDWLIDQYVNQLKSAVQIGEELEINGTTVCRALIKHNIVIRRIGAFSAKALQWLEYISKKENIFIQHVGNIGEYQIPGTRIYADGYCKETNTIYEFHGDTWHGNPEIYSPDEHCHPFDPDITAGALYEKTLQREQRIKQRYYKLIVMWEAEWDKYPHERKR